ncbi:hypothetical protein WP12_03325 [Sphingomonas sp. SRS2]|nr:hypothetical protein WP12_03325 [Sphingomonas sp. SRS2]
MKSSLREIEHTRARWAIMWAARKSIGLSTPQIGRRLGGRDHTTVIHGLRRAEALRASHLPFRELTNALCAAFTTPATKEQFQ